MSRKKIILIIVLSVFAVIAVIIANVVTTTKQQATTTTQPAETSLTLPTVTIENFSKDTGIYNATIQQSIESAIYEKLGGENAATGHVRAGSLKATTEGSAKNTRFIVDIPALKRTYTASLGSDSTTGETSLYILCPTAAEMIYPNFNCTDGTV